MGFCCKSNLGTAVPPESPTGIVIGVHSIGVNFCIWDFIRTAGKSHHPEKDRLPSRSICPGITIHLDICCHQLPIFGHPHFIIKISCMPLIADINGFLPAPMNLHRPPCIYCSQSCVNLSGNILFPSKTSP